MCIRKRIDFAHKYPSHFRVHSKVGSKLNIFSRLAWQTQRAESNIFASFFNARYKMLYDRNRDYVTVKSNSWKKENIRKEKNEGRITNKEMNIWHEQGPIFLVIYSSNPVGWHYVNIAVGPAPKCQTIAVDLYDQKIDGAEEVDEEEK